MIALSNNVYEFTYDVEDINNSIRRTNTLLRAANAVRLSIRDIKEVFEKPNIARIMWTLVQLSRTYNALRRLQKLVIAEMNTATSIMGLMQRIMEPPLPPTGGGDIPTSFNFDALSVRVDAFLENIPIGLNGIDLTNLPENSRIILQTLIEEDAEETVADAKAILNSRIIAAPDEHSYFLESSIHWQPQVDGVRILADAYYAWWVESGHKTRGGGYFPGHWYLTGATDLAKQRLPNKIREALNGLIYNNL